MNFLAHLHLAHITDTSLAGALAGDLVKGPIDHLPQPLQQGIWLHRQLDSHIDAQPQMQALRALFPHPYRRTAGILLDMAFDHQLASHWAGYHGDSLDHFCRQSYHTLLTDPQLPQVGHRLVSNMARGDWLGSYRYREGITLAVKGISRRLSRPQLLEGGDSVLWQHQDVIFDTFEELYPQMMDYARQRALEWPGIQDSVG
ncbi:ACP phosphodiesterase [Ferrimonas futtsuensis]|uniref:acyl carrier protein phosphodiesterase n=1 Tax=Ferrimonas futtsuensis TaxID=364764 RepID=UPI0004283125|nr:ACP phosphodiesterase [Ferrimonas futtsuensis]